MSKLEIILLVWVVILTCVILGAAVGIGVSVPPLILSLKDELKNDVEITNATVNDLIVKNIFKVSGVLYPLGDGTKNQVVATDGNGTLSFKSLAEL
jgi:hypothetical protein